MQQRNNLGLVDTVATIYSLNNFKNTLQRDGETKNTIMMIIDPQSSLVYAFSAKMVDQLYPTTLAASVAKKLLPKERALSSLSHLSKLLDSVAKNTPAFVLQLMPFDVVCQDLQAIVNQADAVVKITPGVLSCIRQTSIIAQDTFVVSAADVARSHCQSSVQSGLQEVFDSNASVYNRLWGGAKAAVGAIGHYGTNHAENAVEKLVHQKNDQLTAAVRKKESEYVEGVSNAVTEAALKGVLTSLVSTGVQCWLLPNMVERVVSSYIGEGWASLAGSTARVCMYGFTFLSYRQRMTEYREHRRDRQVRIQPMAEVEQQVTDAIVNTANEWAPNDTGSDTSSTFTRRCREELPKAFSGAIK